MVEKIVQLISDLEEEKVYVEVKEALKNNIDPFKILNALREAMLMIGEKWKNREYFVPEVILGSEISREVMNILNPILEKNQGEMEHKGIAVVGTVKGDIHDIGKNIFISLLQSIGYKVHDIGIDLPPEIFVEKLKEFNPDILGMSGLLTIAIDSMKLTVDKINEAGLRDNLKIIIGGPFLSEKNCEYVGADAFSKSATEGIEIIKKWRGI